MGRKGKRKLKYAARFHSNEDDHSNTQERRCLSESDADLDNQRHLSDANNSGSSSTSSISRSLESPSTSLELVNPACQSSSSLPGRSTETHDPSALHNSGLTPDASRNNSWNVNPIPADELDSDLEYEQDPPDLAKIVPEEELLALDRREKKRQEVLNELCHTERSHVRNLKVLRLFHRRLRSQQVLPHDVIQALFANLENVLEVHEKFSNALRNKRKDNPIIDEIGSLLLETFDGDNGTYFKNTAAFFCSKQQIGLELLKERRRKDPDVHAFLASIESFHFCRRLQISDMIPMAMQRLTKYPLLFESLCNCTPADTEEYKKIQRAVELSKEILNSVNREKKEVENRQRLIDIQKRLDKSSLEKNMDKVDASIHELRNLDFTAHRLIYDGPLRWVTKKDSKQRPDIHDVHVVILDDMVVVLFKENDKFVLKMHSVPINGKSDRILSKPIIKLQNLVLSEYAIEKRAFFLVNTASSNTCIYELHASTREERSRWFQNINKAVYDYKTRQEESRRDDHPPSNIPTIGTDVEDKYKDVSDSGEPQPTLGDSHTGEASGLDYSGLKVSESADGSFSKDASPAPPDNLSQSNLSPPGPNASDQAGKNTAVSPSLNRRKGEFLRVTESSPLIDPSEVVVAKREVQFATPVVSQYEELRRCSASIAKLYEEKERILSRLSPMPTAIGAEGSNSESEVTAEPTSNASSAKCLVTACINYADQWGRLLNSQKVTNENLSSLRDFVALQKHLSDNLELLLNEIQRRDEDSEMRRQELSRLREQNHGYKERLQARNGGVERHSSPNRLASPTLSPSQSRPNSFMSLSSSSDHHEEDPTDSKDVRTKTSYVPDQAIEELENKESKSNGHNVLTESPNGIPCESPMITAALEEQKSTKDSVLLTNSCNEDVAKNCENLIEEIQSETKLS